MTPMYEWAAFINVVLTAMTATVASVLAGLFFFGLKYSAKSNGRPILRAIIWVWTAIAVHQFAGLYFNIQIASERISVTAPHFEMTVPVNIFLMVSSMYYLWATVRRNPPEEVPVSMPSLTLVTPKLQRE